MVPICPCYHIEFSVIDHDSVFLFTRGNSNFFGTIHTGELKGDLDDRIIPSRKSSAICLLTSSFPGVLIKLRIHRWYGCGSNCCLHICCEGQFLVWVCEETCIIINYPIQFFFCSCPKWSIPGLIVLTCSMHTYRFITVPIYIHNTSTL